MDITAVSLFAYASDTTEIIRLRAPWGIRGTNSERSLSSPMGKNLSILIRSIINGRNDTVTKNAACAEYAPMLSFTELFLIANKNFKSFLIKVPPYHKSCSKTIKMILLQPIFILRVLPLFQRPEQPLPVHGCCLSL